MFFPHCLVVTILNFSTQSSDPGSETREFLEIAWNSKKEFVFDSTNPANTCFKRIAVFKLVNEKSISRVQSEAKLSYRTLVSEK